MALSIDTVADVDGTPRPNQAGISWGLWETFDLTAPPTESGVGLSTDGSAALTVPSTATRGILHLYISDTDMGLYIANNVIAIDTPQNLQWSEPFPDFYLLYWGWPFDEDPDGYIVERNGESFGATNLRVFVTTEPGTYAIRAINDGEPSPPSNPVTIP